VVIFTLNLPSVTLLVVVPSLLESNTPLNVPCTLVLLIDVIVIVVAFVPEISVVNTSELDAFAL